MRAAILAALLGLSGCTEVDRTLVWLDSQLQGTAAKVDRVSALEERVSVLEAKEWVISEDMVEAIGDEHRRRTDRDLDTRDSGYSRTTYLGKRKVRSYFK